jgi:hydroxyethylthiazole kinase-like uncharacterized protein yjeF
MYILSVEQMRQAEAAADAAGQTYAMMMESAGQAVATAVRQLTDPQGLRILVLVGPGNNGGDGLVAAFHLQQMGGLVTCYIWKRKVEGDANFTRARDAGCRILWAQEDAGWAALRQECEQADVVLDALLGTGADRPITGDLAELLGVVRETVERRRRARLPWMKEALQVIDPTLKVPERPEMPLVVAVDVPSGVNCDTGALDPAAVPADVTVTFGFPKRGQFIFPGAGVLGKLLIAEIGIPPRLVKDCHLHLVTTKMVTERLPQRPLDAHKGTFGRALIIAGSVNYTGAPALAAAAATRVGAGLVTLALARSVFPIVAAKLYEPTYILLPESLGVISDEAVDVLCERIQEFDAMLIGPGLGQADEVVRFVHTFLSGELRLPRRRTRIGFVETTAPAGTPSSTCRLPPTVIDADALNALAKAEEWWKHIPAGCVLTPHPGEMARLLGCTTEEVQADRIGVASRAAQQWGQIVVLKGAHTVIASPDGETYILPFANPVLATAGTGDVLAGAIVGLMAQGLSPLDAALVGGFLHGMAAEEVEFSRQISCGVVASDLLPALPVVIQRLRA